MADYSPAVRQLATSPVRIPARNTSTIDRGGVFVSAVATLLMFPFREQLGVLNVLLIFLLLTFAVALTRGIWPAALCAVLGFILFDILFIPPYLTLSVADEDHVLALFVYLGVAIVTARLISRVR